MVCLVLWRSHRFFKVENVDYPISTLIPKIFKKNYLSLYKLTYIIRLRYANFLKIYQILRILNLQSEIGMCILEF